MTDGYKETHGHAGTFGQAEVTGLSPMPNEITSEAVGGVWTPHKGGANPLDDNTMVEVITRSGSTCVMRAGAIIWRYGSFIFELGEPMAADAEVVFYRALSASANVERETVVPLAWRYKYRVAFEGTPSDWAVRLSSIDPSTIGMRSEDYRDVTPLYALAPAQTKKVDGQTGWCTCRLGPCQRHGTCMYTPCRTCA